MRKDIDSETAKAICGQIRMRKHKSALFATPTGIKIKALHNCTDKDIGRDEFIGAYTKNVTYHQIKQDWNDTI